MIMDTNNNKDTAEIFFENVKKFQKIEDDNLINTEQYLEASKCIAKFIDFFGIAFKPVKNDINGNINKLMTIFDKDRIKFMHLNSIVQHEKETLKDDEFHIGTDALTWLNRGLIYNQIFLSLFVEDYKKCLDENIDEISEDLSKHFNQAYDLSLKKYHGWMVQKIFNCCLLAAPNRSTLLRQLGYLNSEKSSSPSELRSIIIDSIENYLESLQSNTKAVSILLLSYGFQP